MGDVGIKERQERGREETARAILDAARELFVAEGYSHVSIRRIAERIEYSPAAIYSYFPSKDDIFLALAEEGFRMLFASGECARQEHAHRAPIDCIRSAFLNVYEFSKNHPEYHALMFLDRSVPRISQDWQRFGFVRDMRMQLTDLIRRAIDAGDFPADCDPEVVFRVLLASVQGVAAMRLCDRLVPGEDADGLARITLEAALTGLRKGFDHSYRADSSCL
jgi:AcrR family transcriptional regulator